LILGLFLTCFVALCAATILLLLFGARLHFASRVAGGALSALLAVGAGEAAARVWNLAPRPVLAAEALLLVVGIVISLARPVWNPVGMAFYASFVAAALSYLGFAAWYTVAGGLSVIGAIASGLLLVLEVGALTLAAWYTFDGCDVVCRGRWRRPKPHFDDSYTPRVSLQVPAYNEPPDMLIRTIQSLEAIDYPSLDIVVIDDNTSDPDTWRPVEEYCQDRPRVRFIHVDDLPGFKAGGLNFLVREHTPPDVELIGVIDADYLVDPGYLRAVVGYFVDPDLAFLQTPQDYREYEGNAYLTACYDAYRYFFVESMPSRNDRDSIIFAGTMGLIRRSMLEELGGWAEWCITEDAEMSLRMLARGWSGVFVERSFGKGIMPLTFGALKSQRFRWCFGGVQILRRHARMLIPWRRDPSNRLTVAQRLDYLFGGMHWFNDLLYLGFTVTLLVTAALLLTTGRVAIRPLLGGLVLLPSALIASGVLRAVWTLRRRTHIGVRRALLAFANWLSMSWTVALACLQALIRADSVFMRTPKSDERQTVIAALRSAWAETALAMSLWAAGAATLVAARVSAFLLVLYGWQGGVYATAPFMSVLNVRSKMSEELERRRRTEWMRERIAARWPYLVGATASLVAVVALAAVLFFGGANPGAPRPPFAAAAVHSGETSSKSPLRALLTAVIRLTPTPTATPSAAASPSDSPSPTASATPTATESPTVSVSQTATATSAPSATATTSATSSPTPSTSQTPS
jgi:cellulose synthase/poly-beta-1,6-N-acetylglucosamine synthase-like glycosyltransferase